MLRKLEHWFPVSGFRLLTAGLLGALMTLAMPPIGAVYILLLCVPGFVWLTVGCKTKISAFMTGWAFGAGYFILGFYWISFALFVDIHSFWWVLPFSLIAGPAAMGLYYGFIPLLARRYKAHPTAYALMFAAAWALMEWVRGHALTGFPWNLIGYTWHYFLPVMQTSAAVGIYGLTLLTLLLAMMPVLPKKLAPVLLILFLLVTGAGATRLYLHPTQNTADVTVRVVQANIPQLMKMNPQQNRENLQKYLDLTASPTETKKPPTFVVWPEVSVNADLRQYPDVAHLIAASLPSGSVGLIGNMGMTEGADETHYYNSVTTLNKQRGVLSVYSKHHLVPFGEYIPFRNLLNLTPAASGIAVIGDFTPGAGISPMHIGTLPKPSPLICYEGIFPGEVARRDDRPDWLVNATNDAWYGRTSGPHQHFEIVRMRAIEEGLPLVRAANTGISAVIDPLGRITALKKLGETGVLDAPLPAALPPTIYSKVGDTLFFLMLALLTILGETLRRKE